MDYSLCEHKPIKNFLNSPIIKDGRHRAKRCPDCKTVIMSISYGSWKAITETSGEFTSFINTSGTKTPLI